MVLVFISESFRIANKKTLSIGAKEGFSAPKEYRSYAD
jgi:hypothetical protein